MTIDLSSLEYVILSSIKTGLPTGLPDAKPGQVGESEMKLHLSGLGLASFGASGLHVTDAGEQALAAHRALRVANGLPPEPPR